MPAPAMTEDSSKPIQSSQETAGQKFDRLVAIMSRLRGDGGCPWDREQSFDTIKPYLLEETYEVMDSIDARDWRGLTDELGDLLLQPVFFAQMASEQDLFHIGDSLDAINEKLVRRHPHIFSDVNAETAGDVKRNWDLIKAEEKKTRGERVKGLLESVPRSTPALVEAQAISAKAAGAGFDWKDTSQVIEKLHEELDEVKRAESPEEVAGEIGDLLFVVVNLARFLKVDAEQALRGASAKFRDRFGYVERSLAGQGKTLPQSNIEEMEALWQEAKGSRR